MTNADPTKMEIPPTVLRPTWADIDLDALRHNVAALSARLSQGTSLLCVLKADAYGHGAVPLAQALVGCSERGGRSSRRIPLWGFGVSSVEEGITLRSAGIQQPILILGSLYPFDSFRHVLDYSLTPTIASALSAQALSEAAEKKGATATVHVKVDTGMGRIGVSPETALDLLKSVSSSPRLKLEGCYTHLASAESSERTEAQLASFRRVLSAAETAGVKIPIPHVANSAGTIRHASAHFSLVRVGLSLYGIYPEPGLGSEIELRPVLSWRTKIVFLKKVKPGTLISYGGTHRVTRTSRLATLPVGYADGYRRGLSNKGTVLIRGHRCPVVGRVTMDQIIVDVTDVGSQPGEQPLDVGEEAVLLGSQGTESVTADDMARLCDTIPYEIVCGITARVPRVYRGEDNE
ncbi:MAG TPA: alanine racemase [Elusimicrobiota bacterium]|nr:alanine racemase [Elusimicrobiota bacterium]